MVKNEEDVLIQSNSPSYSLGNQHVTSLCASLSHTCISLVAQVDLAFQMQATVHKPAQPAQKGSKVHDNGGADASSVTAPTVANLSTVCLCLSRLIIIS